MATSPLHDKPPESQFPSYFKISLPYLLERVIYNILSLYISDNILDPLQSGFRPQHSAEDALLKFNNNLVTVKINGNYLILLLLDPSATFDTIDHPLLKKLLFLDLQDCSLLVLLLPV